MLLKNIVSELEQTIHGGVVSKVFQPDERNIILRIFLRGRDYKLIISAHHSHPRLHLTDESFVNPPTPLRFCAFLRSRIINARVEGVEQADNEKIARIVLKKAMDGVAEYYTLIAELTGKSSNIILLDGEGKVMDALKYFPADSSVRAVSPGIVLDPLPPGPVVEEEPPVKPDHMSWNEMADRYYAEVLREDLFISDRNNLRRTVNEALKKAKRKLENLNKDKKGAEEGLGYTKLGELLTANFRLMKRGMKEVEAVDYTVVPPATVKVKLDEKLSPKENVEKYFKRAKKSKTGLEMLARRIPETETEIEYLENLLYSLEEMTTREDLQAIKDELTEGGYIRKMEERPGELKERVEKAEPVRRFTSSEGFEVLCGKSGAGNDMLVQKLSAQEDIWFHVSKMPGSHVLIKVAGRKNELTKKTIEEAAALAAWHSKARNASKVEVVYTEAKHVKKPKGAKPGLVTIKDFKTIVVRPKEME